MGCTSSTFKTHLPHKTTERNIITQKCDSPTGISFNDIYKGLKNVKGEDERCVRYCYKLLSNDTDDTEEEHDKFDSITVYCDKTTLVFKVSDGSNNVRVVKNHKGDPLHYITKDAPPKERNGRTTSKEANKSDDKATEGSKGNGRTTSKEANKSDDKTTEDSKGNGRTTSKEANKSDDKATEGGKGNGRTTSQEANKSHDKATEGSKGNGRTTSKEANKSDDKATEDSKGNDRTTSQDTNKSDDKATEGGKGSGSTDLKKNTKSDDRVAETLEKSESTDKKAKSDEKGA